MKIYFIDITLVGYEIQQYLQTNKVKMMPQEQAILIRMLAENMDANMALCSSFWNARALGIFYQQVGITDPSIVNPDRLAKLEPLVQRVGLMIYQSCFANNLFRSDIKESFPYIVKDITNTQLILQEDTQLTKV